MKVSRNKQMNNYQMNIMRGTIALVTSEVLNKFFEKPLSIYENVKMFIKVGKCIYKVITLFNENTGIFEFKESEKVSSLSYEYKQFLKDYPKVKSIYRNQSKGSKILGKKVQVVVDRPIGSSHPTSGMKYELNYGFIPNCYALDGEEQDAYIIDESNIVKKYKGRVIAIIHRTNDIEDKWVVSSKNKKYSIKEIQEATKFQEQYFETEVEILD